MLIVLALATGCATVVSGRPAAVDVVAADRDLIVGFFERSNAAASDGTAAQQKFFTETQHPDFDDDICDLGNRTLSFDPTLSTLRPDTRWKPDGADRAPRGRVYVVAVTISVQADRLVLANQIGLMHLVVLDGATYGFAPCPTGA